MRIIFLVASSKNLHLLILNRGISIISILVECLSNTEFALVFLPIGGLNRYFFLGCLGMLSLGGAALILLVLLCDVRLGETNRELLFTI